MRDKLITKRTAGKTPAVFFVTVFKIFFISKCALIIN